MAYHTFGTKAEPGPWTAPTRRRKTSISWAALILAIAFVYCLFSNVGRFTSTHSIITSGQTSHTSTKESPFRWDDIQPSTEIQYHPCYEGLQCARLDVPMDYNAAEDETARVALAVIRRPAKVPVSSPHYGGAILTNPGGPGGSGVAQMLYHGPQLQVIVASDTPVEEATESDKYFDIIGFDPRGVNHSRPLLTCFPDSFARQTWNLQASAEGLLGSSETSLRTAWRRATALSAGCSSRFNSDANTNATNFLEHVNTTPVAADMVSIIEAHGRWREHQGQKAQVTADLSHGHDSQQPIARRTKWRKGQEPLLYWGFSYGTVIGATFAAMYPERVSRMVLDGVVDAQDYFNGPWLSNLEDADHILDELASHCSDAGPDACPLWQPGGPEAIQTALDKLLHGIWDDPLAVVGDGVHGPEIITWTDVKTALKDALYQPILLGPMVAQLLASLSEGGNGRAFADAKQAARRPSCRSAACEAAGPFSDACVVPDWNELEATSAILCTDAEGIGSLTEDEFREYWGMLRNQSETMGDYWAQIRLACAGWQARAKWRFSTFDNTTITTDTSREVYAAKNTAHQVSGDTKTTDTAHEVPVDTTTARTHPVHLTTTKQKTIYPVPLNTTSHPLLWLSNTLDPVTPLSNAHRMSARFAGSVVLEQNCEGHCSFAAPSLCTAKAVRQYFQTGVLPAVGARCDVDAKPFQPGMANRAEDMSAADTELLGALVEMANVRVPRPGVGRFL